MFTTLFERPVALRRQTSTPLAVERCRYLRHLTRQGLARQTVRDVAEYLVAIVERLRLSDDGRKKIPDAMIQRQAVRWSRRHFARDITQPDVSRRRFFHQACRWFRFMGWLEPRRRRVTRFSPAIEVFSSYMRDEQGLAPSTICGRVALLHDILLRINGPRRSLRAITVQDVDRELTGKYTLERYGRATIQAHAGALRAFFRFAERKGWCRAGLAAAIQSPRVYRNESVPFGPSWDDVQRLLATTEGDRASHIRNRAVILLLSVYGLRAGEVVRLCLEDFDWQGERLKIRRPKQRKAQEFPLVRVVGDAVLRYLKHARPAAKQREVFVTCQPPYRPLRPGSLWAVVARPLRALKVKLPHYGPHCLRHACATHLLNAGLSLKEIGDQLGHTHPDTTRIYAKVDLPHLREVGRIDLRGLL